MGVRGCRGASGGCGSRIANFVCGCVSRPGQGSAVALSASPRARRPGCPRLPREDGCQREPSPRTAAAPARRNRQPRVYKSAVFYGHGRLVHPHILPVLVLPVAANHASDCAGSPGPATRAQLWSKVPRRGRPSSRLPGTASSRPRLSLSSLTMRALRPAGRQGDPSARRRFASVARANDVLIIADACRSRPTSARLPSRAAFPRAPACGSPPRPRFHFDGGASGNPAVRRRSPG